MSTALLTELKQGDYYVSTYKHPNSLCNIMKDFTPEEYETIITLAASALKELHSSSTTLQYKDMLSKEISKHTEKFQEETTQLLAKQEKETQSLQTIHKRKLAELDAELKTLRSELDVSEFSLQKMREQFEELKKTSNSVLQISIQEIVKQKEEQYQKEIDRLQKSHSSMVERLESQARERVSQCDQQHKESLEKLKELYAEKEAKLRKEYEKSLISSERGKQGEQEFDDLVKEHVLWPPLLNMSKTSHGTDRGCRIRKCNTLFEIKNYTNDVPSKEVEKFERDMAENSDVPLGVFISLRTNIISKKSGNFIVMNWTPKSQLLIYINSFYTHSPGDVLTFIDMCADIAWMVFDTARQSPQESEGALQLQSRLEQVKVFVEKELKRTTEFLTTLAHDKKFMIEQITKQNANYTYSVQQSKQALQGMLSILLGADVEDEQIDQQEEKSQKPKKSSKKKASENPK
jgi:hypothetical protein